MTSFKFDPTKTLTIHCPKCRRRFTKTLRELRTGRSFTCSQCNVVFDTKDVDRSFKKVESELERLQRDLRRMFK